jgi:hypothetical protein
MPVPATASNAGNGVNTRHASYDRFSMKWQRVRDVVSGQDEIHKAGVRYLPMLKDEEPAEYVKRVERTPFYNASWRTIASFVGMLFRKPPVIEVPTSLDELLDDVTMSGVSFSNFAQDVTLEDLSISRVGVLVDYPDTSAYLNEEGATITLAQAQALGFRPSMALYKAESIINWRYEFIANRTILTQVRLSETASINKNEFEVETEERIRVLDLYNGQYRVRLFKAQNGEKIGWDIFPKINGVPLDEIPFYFIGPDGAGASELSEPVLIDLVDLNIKHYQVSADYEHGCHMTALPTPVISGADGGNMDGQGNVTQPTYYIGSTTAWLLPMGATAEFLEFHGQGLQSLEKNLERKEAQMASIGARMLTPDKAGVEAAETLAMRHSGEHSILSAIAIAVSEGLTKALKMFARFANADSNSIKFEINRDFMPFAITPQALTALLSTVQAGKMSPESFFDLLKRGDLVEQDLTYEAEQARIDAAAPPAPVPAPVGGRPPLPGANPPAPAPGAPAAP